MHHTMRGPADLAIAAPICEMPLTSPSLALSLFTLEFMNKNAIVNAIDPRMFLSARSDTIKTAAHVSVAFPGGLVETNHVQKGKPRWIGMRRLKASWRQVRRPHRLSSGGTTHGPVRRAAPPVAISIPMVAWVIPPPPSLLSSRRRKGRVSSSTM
mmetsp:Transcript_11560/g.43170  ORF Transcript_11560/g.43170 Transcript_11560/m.43170 type:complete len:155 (-) Transcript_11560:516-980(-)